MWRSFNNTIDICFKRAQQGMDIDGTFGICMPSKVQKESIPCAKLGHNKTTGKSKRKKSAHEIHSSYKRQRHFISNKSPLVLSNNKTKSCSFCKERGHFIDNCKKINSWGKGRIIHPEQRVNLCASMLKDGFYTCYIINNDSYNIKPSETLPTGMKGIVLHRILKFTDANTTGKYVECTLLMGFGDKHELYKQYPFTLCSICAFIVKSQSSIIISFLTTDGLSSIDIINDSNIVSSSDTNTIRNNSQCSGNRITGNGNNYSSNDKNTIFNNSQCSGNKITGNGNNYSSNDKNTILNNSQSSGNITTNVNEQYQNNSNGSTNFRNCNNYYSKGVKKENKWYCRRRDT